MCEVERFQFLSSVLDANELYDTLQSREEEEEEEQYIEMTSLRQDVQVNWKSAYRTLEVYNIVQNCTKLIYKIT